MVADRADFTEFVGNAKSRKSSLNSAELGHLAWRYLLPFQSYPKPFCMAKSSLPVGDAPLTGDSASAQS